jgi:hypothetical protein
MAATPEFEASVVKALAARGPLTNRQLLPIVGMFSLNNLNSRMRSLEARGVVTSEYVAARSPTGLAGGTRRQPVRLWSLAKRKPQRS